MHFHRLQGQDFVAFSDFGAYAEGEGSNDARNGRADLERVREVGFEAALRLGLDRFVEDSGFARHPVELEGDDAIAILIGSADIDELGVKGFAFLDADGGFFARLQSVKECRSGYHRHIGVIAD